MEFISGFLTIFASSDSGGMFNRGWDIGGIIGDVWWNLVYNVITFLMQVVYVIEGCFYYLAGLGSLRGLGSENGVEGLLPTINESGEFELGILIGNQSFQNTLLVMIVIGVIMVVIFLAYALIKGVFNREGKSEAMIKTSLAHTIRAVIFIALAPTLVMIVMATISFLLTIGFSAISQTLSGGGGTSIAYQLYKACFVGGSSDMEKFAQAVGSLPYGDNVGQTRLILGLGSGDTLLVPYADQFSIFFFDLETLVNKTTVNYQNYFSYGVGFIGSCFTVVALVLLTIRVAERLFELLIDYILCIPAISTMPTDGGQRFGQWTQLFLGRMINFVGSVIAMLVYLFVLTNISDIVNQFEGTGNSDSDIAMNFFRAILLLVLIIAGAFACVKGGNTVSQLIGGAAAQAEANSSAQTMRLAALGSAFTVGVGKATARIGGRSITKGITGGASLGKNMKAKEAGLAQQAFQAKQNAVMDQFLAGGGGAAMGAGAALTAAVGATTLGKGISGTPPIPSGVKENAPKGNDSIKQSNINTNTENNNLKVNNESSPMEDLKNNISNNSSSQYSLSKKDRRKVTSDTILHAGVEAGLASARGAKGWIGKGIGAVTGFVAGSTVAALTIGVSKGWNGVKKGSQKFIKKLDENHKNLNMKRHMNNKVIDLPNRRFNSKDKGDKK